MAVCAKLVTEGVSISLARDTNSVKAMDNASPFIDKMSPLVDGQFNTDDYTAFFHGFAQTHIDALSQVTDCPPMEHYDPQIPPDASDWLDLDEGERIILVEQYHRDARVPLPKAARRLHATIHAIVENQLALLDEPVVRALARLQKEGLSRHDAIHAIGSVVAEQIYDLLKAEDAPEVARTRYYAAIERLTAARWRKKDG